VEIPGLTPLNMGMGIDASSGKKKEDVELFPKFKGNMASNKTAEDGEKFTSLLGQFVPISETADEERCVCLLDGGCSSPVARASCLERHVLPVPCHISFSTSHTTLRAPSYMGCTGLHTA
jgi:hypothetical protein